jgi:hypothetical protein
MCKANIPCSEPNPQHKYSFSCRFLLVCNRTARKAHLSSRRYRRRVRLHVSDHDLVVGRLHQSARAIMVPQSAIRSFADGGQYVRHA